MRTTTISFDKARTFASHLCPSRSHRGGWGVNADRDMERGANEIHLMAQSSHERII